MKSASIILLALVAAATVTGKYVPKTKPGRNSRLDAGEVAEPGQFPYAVGLRNMDDVECGGAIIGPSHIITEAWCFDVVPDMTIIAGCEDYYSPDCQEYKFQNVWMHPDSSGLGENDLAIISIVGEFEISDLVQIIPISADTIEDGAMGTVTGWSPELRWLDVVIAECDAGWIDPTIICSSPSVVGSGDYGCPLVVDGVLAGIPILGGSVDIHQRISPYVDWINEVIGAK